MVFVEFAPAVFDDAASKGTSYWISLVITSSYNDVLDCLQILQSFIRRGAVASFIEVGKALWRGLDGMPVLTRPRLGLLRLCQSRPSPICQPAC